jgi:uncharacterized small protein (DUF1192 family)
MGAPKMTDRHVLALAAAFLAFVALAVFSSARTPNFTRTNAESGIERRDEVAATISTKISGQSGELSRNAIDPRSQANALVEILGKTLDEFIKNQTALKKEAEQLEAELNKAQNAAAAAEARFRSEKAKIGQLVAERDQALASAKHHASAAAKAATLELQALLENARRGLIVERESRVADQQKSEQIIQDLRSRLAVSERDHDALKSLHEKLRAEYEAAARAKAYAETALDDMTKKFDEVTRKSQELTAAIARLEQSEKTRQEILAWQQFVEESKSLVSHYRPLIKTAKQAHAASETDLYRAKSLLAKTEELAKPFSFELGSFEDAIYEPERLTEKAAARTQQRFNTLVALKIILDKILKSVQILPSGLREILQRIRALEAQKDTLQSLIDEKIESGKAAAELFKTLSKEASDLDALLESLEWRLSVVPEGETGRKILAQIEDTLKGTGLKADVFAAHLIDANSALRRTQERADTARKQASQFSEQVAQLVNDIREAENRCDILAQRIQAQHVRISSAIGGDLAATGEILNERKEALLALERSNLARTGDIDTAKENLQAIDRILTGLRTSLSEEAASLLKVQKAAIATRAKFEEFFRPTVGESEHAQIIGNLAPNTLGDDHWAPNKEERGAVAERILPLLKEIAEVREKFENQFTRIDELADSLPRLQIIFSNIEKYLHARAETSKKLEVRYEQLDSEINALAERDRSLAERTRNHEKKVSKALAKVSALKGRLSSLSSRFATVSKVAYPVTETSDDAAAAESASITEWNGRLQLLRERLALLGTSIQSKKSAPSVLSAPGDASAQNEVGAGNDRPVGATSADKGQNPQATTEIDVNCNLSRPSCQRWLHLKRKSLRQANQGMPATQK